MNVLTAVMLAAIALIALTAAAAAFARGWRLGAWRQAPGLAPAPGARVDRLLAVALTTWLGLFTLVCALLLVTAAVALFYVVALGYGELIAQLPRLPHTIGNFVVHLFYPLQMFVLSLVTFLLAVGGWQVVFGPLNALARLRLRVEDLGAWTRRLAGLLAIVAALEVVKIVLFSLLVAPADLPRFFARDALPKADPLAIALLAAALLVAVAAARRSKP